METAPAVTATPRSPYRAFLIVTVAFSLSLLCYFYLPQPAPIRAGLVIFLLAGILWLTEAINITFTALLIPVMAILFQVMPVKQAFTDFANPVIFLFMGGFALAAALARRVVVPERFRYAYEEVMVG